MSELTIAGHVYRTGRLNALQQFHVGRRLAPVLAVMGVKAVRILAGMAQGEEKAEDAEVLSFMPVLPEMASVISRMSDEDADYIIFHCLETCTREDSGRWQAVAVQGKLLYQDDSMDMGVLLRLVAAVVQDNLRGFLTGLGAEVPSSSS